MTRLGWTIGLGVPAGAAAWIAAGAFLPLAHDAAGVEYVFLSASYARLALSIAIAMAAIAALHLNHRRFAPAILLASLDPIALLAFVPPFAALAGPLVYVGIDLRRWRIAAAALLLAIELDRVNGGRWRRAVVQRWTALPPRVRLHTLDAALVLFAVAFAVSTTTLLRFSDALHGDEPKYVRYCENLYQGNGFDLTDFKDAAKLPPDAPSHVLANVRYIFSTIAIEARRAEQDVRRYRRDPDFQFNRGKFIDGWFIYSKNGRIFQVHTPGVSLLMMPFYYVDRVWLSHGTTAYQGQVAGRLWATNGYFLLMYALLALVTFRLLRNALGGDALPWLLAAIGAASIPIAAFAFQMYPETTAGVLTIATCNFLAFKSGRAASIAEAAGFGTLVGYLPWLHVRFTAVAGVLFLWGVVALWRRRSLLAAFVVSSGLPVALLCLHVYHITGSPIPSALYTVPGVRDSLSLAGVPVGLRGFLLDRRWGLLPYSPYFALAAAGVWAVFRRDRLAATFAALVLLAAAVSGAAHSWTAAGGSPLRYLVAVMPLVLVPVGCALTGPRPTFARGASVGKPFVVIAFAALALISVQSAVAYNNYHFKATGPIVDDSVSGWKINLLFPDVRSGRPASQTVPDYLAPPNEVWRRVAGAYAAQPCALCVSSRHGRVSPPMLDALKPTAKR